MQNDNKQLDEKVDELELLHAKYELLIDERSALSDDLQMMIDKLKNE